MIRPLTLLAAAVALAGCSAPSIPFYRGGSSLTVESRSDNGARLSTRFENAIYGYDGRDSVTIVLFDGTEAAPTQAATVRLFWRPQAGRTPISSQATNSTIQYVILPPAPAPGTGTAGAPAPDETAGEVGVYSGAGYVFPKSKPGGGYFEAGLWDATLLLADHSSGFADQLGRSVVRGDISARRDDAAVEAMLKRISEHVTARLGYPRFVSALP